MDNDVKQSADFYDLMAWFQLNRKRVISIAVLVVVVGAVVGGYYWHKSNVETQAQDALSIIKPPSSAEAAASMDAQPYLKVADNYPGTRAGGRALLIAGGNLFDAGKFDQAKQTFERFMREYGDDVLANQALVGIAASLEAQGNTKDAAARYDDFIKGHPGDPTLPQAKSALARIYVAQNKPELALHLYEDLARGGNNDTWSSEAGIQYQELLAKYPNLRKPAPAPTPAPTAPTGLAMPTNLAALTNLAAPKK